MYKPILFLTTIHLILLILGCGQTEPKTIIVTSEQMNGPKSPTQLVVVLSEHPDSVNAVLSKYEFSNKKWIQVGATHDVTLGRTGLAKGRGTHDLLTGIDKKEGDGKSPAGMFEFGTAFGYASKETAPKLKIPYVPITEVTQCIEDSKSKYYNQIVDNSKVIKDWETADFMKRKDDLYKWGVFVKHNTPAKAEAGSCIFFHLWRGPGKHTAGCTAMTEENILDLIKWLDASKEPRLVQLVKSDLPKFVENFNLPNENFK